MQDVRAVFVVARQPQRLSLPIRALFGFRRFLGRLLRWDRPAGVREEAGSFHVLPVSGLTKPYLALIDPFPRWLVYPALLRRMHESWSREFSLGAR